MVLSAVLRDPARHSEQAYGRVRVVRIDPDPLRAAVARHLESALRQLPAALPSLLLDLRTRVRCTRIFGLEATGGLVRHVLADFHLLLFLPFPGDPAGHRSARDAETAAV